jgi:hypothetical protein
LICDGSVKAFIAGPAAVAHVEASNQIVPAAAVVLVVVHDRHRPVVGPFLTRNVPDQPWLRGVRNVEEPGPVVLLLACNGVHLRRIGIRARVWLVADVQPIAVGRVRLRNELQRLPALHLVVADEAYVGRAVSHRVRFLLGCRWLLGRARLALLAASGE